MTGDIVIRPQDWTSSLEWPGQNNFEQPRRNLIST